MTTYAVINGKKTKAPDGAIAWKYSDPTEDARWVYDESDLDSIKREDPGLIVMAKDAAAVSLGKRGGASKSRAKRAASAANGKKGGRPRAP